MWKIVRTTALTCALAAAVHAADTVTEGTHVVATQVSNDEHSCPSSEGLEWCKTLQACYRPEIDDCPQRPSIPNRFRLRMDQGIRMEGEDEMTWTYNAGHTVVDLEAGVSFADAVARVKSVTLHLKTLYNREHNMMCRWGDSGDYCCEESIFPAESNILRALYDLPEDSVYDGERLIEVNNGSSHDSVLCDVWIYREVQEYYFTKEGKWIGKYDILELFDTSSATYSWVDTDPHGDCNDVICDDDIPDVDFNKTCPSKDSFMPTPIEDKDSTPKPVDPSQDERAVNTDTTSSSISSSSLSSSRASPTQPVDTDSDDSTMVVAGVVGSCAFVLLAAAVVYTTRKVRASRRWNEADVQTELMEESV
eukprot:GFYU01001433.1.p1 GENE.GFYU01001433.1~~GFYU01001433.1.p1  ORF type:complete len:364 (+),score=67.45 GFYU01001433.1:77-1168(+)